MPQSLVPWRIPSECGFDFVHRDTGSWRDQTLTRLSFHFSPISPRDVLFLFFLYFFFFFIFKIVAQLLVTF